MTPLLKRVDPSQVDQQRSRPVDETTMQQAAAIVEGVRSGGETALREHARRLGDLGEGEPLVRTESDLRDAYEGLEPKLRSLLARVASRVERFALLQRKSLTDLTVDVPGGRAGHRWQPVESVGAYAPGGRHSLPSSVLMTVIPARVADVDRIWVASPRPTPVTLAAAWLAGADGLIAVGGAQAVAALAFGTVTPPSDIIVGPGNRWVTAAKKHLYGEVGIDFLAGPSEIVVIADGDADPGLVAADLLAQAEHDTDALPVLICTDDSMADRVDEEMALQLRDLPTADVAREALGNGYAVVVDGLAAAAAMARRVAPEHLALHVLEPDALGESLGNYGSLFLGRSAAEAFADYGAGPNHVLPTGGTARFQAGLSVMTFLKPATWLELDSPDELISDTALMARIEGLEAHASAALRRQL